MNQQQPNPSQRQPRSRNQPALSRSARRRRNRRRRANAITSSGSVALQPSRITRRVVTNLTKRSPTISSAGLAWLRQYLNPMGPPSTSVAASLTVPPLLLVLPIMQIISTYHSRLVRPFTVLAPILMKRPPFLMPPLTLRLMPGLRPT